MSQKNDVLKIVNDEVEFEGIPFRPTQGHIWVDHFNLLDEPNALKVLKEGNVLNHVKAVSGSEIYKLPTAARCVIEMTGFKDETKENGVPRINFDNKSEASNFTVVMTKMITFREKWKYLTVQSFTPEFVCRQDYARMVVNCLDPSLDVKVWIPGKDGWVPKNEFTERITVKHTIRKVTNQGRYVQMDIDMINANDAISEGIKWDTALLRERTKQNIEKKDSVAVMKKLVLRKAFKNGCLEMQIDVVADRTIYCWMVNNAPGIVNQEKVKNGAERLREWLSDWDPSNECNLKKENAKRTQDSKDPLEEKYHKIRYMVNSVFGKAKET